MDMYTAILILHIICGTICLLSGATAIVSKKGRKLHNNSGRAFYWFMYAVGASVLVMTLMKFNPFLLSIAIFSVYMSYSGKQSISYWRLKQPYTPTLKDKLPCYIGLLTALFMIAYQPLLMWQTATSYVPVLSVFGIILLILAWRDIKLYSKPDQFVPRNELWLFLHIGKMSGAYIATFTAFLLNNVHMDPPWVLWLGPTAVGLPLIFFAVARWKKKTAPRHAYREREVSIL
jgi:hypothetical protein